jgi:sugar/nucleoside kinase (ribokinase family)
MIALGDNVIDYYRNTKECFPGGNAVNVAVHAAKQGAVSEYMGNLGTDRFAGVITEALRTFGVDYSHCPVLSGKTTKVCRYDVTDGERTFVSVETGEDWAGPIRLEEADLKHLAEADLIVCSCNAKIPEQVRAVQELPPVFAYDFGEKEKYRTEEYYDLVCRRIDLAMFSCEPMEKKEFEEFCRPLHKRGVVHILATAGAEGQLLSAGGRIIKKGVQKVVPSDTMGAGDSFLAAFLNSLMNAGWRKNDLMPEAALAAALQAGQEASARNCMQQGGFGVRSEVSPVS